MANWCDRRASSNFHASNAANQRSLKALSFVAVEPLTRHEPCPPQRKKWRAEVMDTCISHCSFRSLLSG